MMPVMKGCSRGQITAQLQDEPTRDKFVVTGVSMQLTLGRLIGLMVSKAAWRPTAFSDSMTVTWCICIGY